MADIEEFDLIETGADEELLSVLADIGDTDGVNVKVYRARKGSKALSFLFECLPHEFSLAYIRDNYGTGDYRVQVREGSKMKANKLIGIEALASLPTAAKAGAGDETFSKLLEMMAEQNKEQKQDMQAMMQQNMQMMMLMMGKQQNNTPQLTPTDMVNMLSGLSGIVKGNPQPAADPQSIFNIFMQGLNMARELSPPTTGADTNDLLIKMVEQFGPVFQHALTTPQATAIGAPQTHITQRQALPGVPAAGAQQTQQEGDEMNRMIQGMLRPKLRELVEVAKRAGDIDLYTDLVLDQVPMGYVGQLMQQPDPVGFLISIEPSIEPYRTWFESLLANIAAVLNEEEGLTPDAGDAIHPETGEGEKPTDAVAVVVPGKAKPNPKPKPKPKPEANG